MNSGPLKTCLLACMAVLLAAWPLRPALAQAEGEEVVTSPLDEDGPVANLGPAEAQQLLERPLPEAGPARFDLLERQYGAAVQLAQRGRALDIARQLAEVAATRAAQAQEWVVIYLNAEYVWGRSGAALDACEAYLTDTRLSPLTRASVALRQTYFTVARNDRAILARIWSRADGLVAQLRQSGQLPPALQIDWLQSRSEVERLGGDLAASTATLREALGVARADQAAARNERGPQAEHRLRETAGRVDGSQGMLVYALVRQNRPQEAIEIAQGNIALWRAGRMSDGLGARWNYRLATSLNATQQFEAALAAARLSDEMLQRAGSSTASHTRWLARQEIVRALVGLRRWPEADAAYRGFLADMPPDVLARTRASDWRMNVLLAAKAGRLEEANEAVERTHRFRTRLYGPRHPLLQEVAGVRGVVRLLRGDLRGAMGDYETLFASVLDQRSGWLDLDLRGVRGYVFGIAFDEFMAHVAAQSLAGRTPDAAMLQRAFQLADRLALGGAQRALTDSSARVLATSPGLARLLEEEQAVRQKSGAVFGVLASLLGEEDRMRRESQAEAFKAMPEDERRAHAERLKALREQIRQRQGEGNDVRGELAALRERIATQFPDYADLVTPLVPKPDELARSLLPGEGLLLVHSTDQATLAWLLRPGAPMAFAASRLSRRDLAARVATLRARLDLAGAPAPAEAASAPDLAALHALYREVFGPLDEALATVRVLSVATQGPLAGFPLGALVTAAPADPQAVAWWLRRSALAQLPAASALQSLRRTAGRPVAVRPLLGFGDPAFQRAAGVEGNAATAYDAERGFRYGRMPPLPDTRTELLAIAGALGADPTRDLLLGPAATRRAVLAADLSDRRVVAFATHALMPGELPGVSKPSLALAAAADERESPLLELDDVLGLRLNAQWVLLSACNTAAGERGDGAMSGLVRGFFFAGARSVLATHWAVESRSAAQLTAGTFGRAGQGGSGRADSLRQAQLELADGRAGEGRWRHPFYWSAYALFGDPLR
jgi:CHAT domain-containing protein